MARHGSFGAAADALCVSQSAISHQIRHLETWLGGSLFDRSSGRPRLLPHGQDLARDLTSGFGGIEAACNRARVQGDVQPLVIAAIPSVAVCWLIPRLSRFRAAHPDIPIRIIYSLHGHEIDFGEVNLAFVFSDTVPGAAGIRADRFLSGASIPVCAGALSSRIAAENAGSFLAAGLLHDTDTGGWLRWFARAGLEVPETLPGPVFEDFNLLRAAALAGQGIALCPSAMIRPDMEQKLLVPLSPVTILEEYDYYLLFRSPAPGRMTDMAATFRDWALSEAAGPE